MKDELERLRLKVAELQRKCGQLEMNLKEIEGRFLQIFHASSKMMTITTLKEGRMIDLNEASASLSGFKREDLIGRLPTEINLFADPNLAGTLVQKLREEGSIRNFEARVRTKAGDMRTVLLSADPITVDEEPCLLSVSVDITAREKEADALRRSEEKYRMLTSQLLAFGRKQIMQPEILNLNTVISQMNSMLRRLIGEDIEFTFIAQPNLRLVNADPGQIQQIIMNLVVNARDAMPHGGKLVIETANIYLEEAYVQRHPMVHAGLYVMLAISDNGVGMDEATQAHLFEPFFTTKQKGKGTGLGLSTVYGIVKQSNGFIWIYSELGKGTTFKLYYPQAGEEIAERKEDGEANSEFRGSETVLVVEDEKAVRALAGRILRDHGYNVLEASGGTEALNTAQEYTGEIHLVLADVVMPGISGSTLVAQLETARPGVKALYVSGYTDNAIVHHDILDSDVAFLQKPFTVDGLIRKVREVLDS